MKTERIVFGRRATSALIASTSECEKKIFENDHLSQHVAPSLVRTG